MDGEDASVLTGLSCLPRIVEGDVSLNVRWKVVDDAFLLSEEVIDLPYELATQILGFEYDGVKSMNLHLVQATSWCLAVVTHRVDWRIHAFVDEQKYYCVWVERTAEHEDQRRILMPRHFFDRYHEIMQSTLPSEERNERLEGIVKDMESVFGALDRDDAEWSQKHQTIIALYHVISDSRNSL